MMMRLVGVAELRVSSPPLAEFMQMLWFVRWGTGLFHLGGV